MSDAHLYGRVLTVDLDALAANYRQLRAAAQPSECGATVKADAYGLGLGPVAQRLAQEGCRRFYVATLSEGQALRAVLPRAATYVFDGVETGSEAELVRQDLVPVLNSLPQIERWTAHSRRANVRLRCVLHVDTGMNRLGLSERELELLADSPQLLQGLAIDHVMTHLACADTPEHPQNRRQLALFEDLRARLPAAPTSIGNSAATLLGPEFRGDIARPGIALYGANPFGDRRCALEEVVRLEARVIQVRQLPRAQAVGYGATCALPAGTRLATVGVGYADGYPWALGNRGRAAVAGVRVPVVGRVSMDLLTLDVSALEPAQVQPGTAVELLGGAVPIEELAHAAGTISYEILTSLGSRLQRSYVERRGQQTVEARRGP